MEAAADIMEANASGGGECEGDGGECKGGDEVDYPLAQLRSTTRPRGRAAQPRPTGDGHEIALGPHVVLRQLERRPSNSMRSTSSGRGNGATQCCRRCSCYRRPGRIDDLPTWFG